MTISNFPSISWEIVLDAVYLMVVDFYKFWLISFHSPPLSKFHPHPRSTYWSKKLTFIHSQILPPNYFKGQFLYGLAITFCFLFYLTYEENQLPVHLLGGRVEGNFHRFLQIWANLSLSMRSSCFHSLFRISSTLPHPLCLLFVHSISWCKGFSSNRKHFYYY